MVVLLELCLGTVEQKPEVLSPPPNGLDHSYCCEVVGKGLLVLIFMLILMVFDGGECSSRSRLVFFVVVVFFRFFLVLFLCFFFYDFFRVFFSFASFGV